MEMQEINHNGAVAFQTAHASPYFYQMVGSLTALEAIYAYITSKDVRRSGYTRIGISLSAGVRYKRFMAPLEDTRLHELVMVHPAALKDWSGENFLIVASENEDILPVFIGHLQRTLKLPVLPTWAHKLWEMGLLEYEQQKSSYGGNTYVDHNAPITRISSVGILAWMVSTAGFEEAWLEIIRNILEEERNYVSIGE